VPRLAVMAARRPQTGLDNGIKLPLGYLRRLESPDATSVFYRIQRLIYWNSPLKRNVFLRDPVIEYPEMRKRSRRILSQTLCGCFSLQKGVYHNENSNQRRMYFAFTIAFFTRNAAGNRCSLCQQLGVQVYGGL
jgi:hypothetical protein